MVELDNQRYSYVLSIIDCFSRFLWLRALTNKQSKTVAGKSEQIYLEFGPPKMIHTDRGPEFQGTVKELAAKLNINMIHSRPYYPSHRAKLKGPILLGNVNSQNTKNCFNHYRQKKKSQCCLFSSVSVSVSVSAQDGIVALRKANTRSAPSLSSLPKVALETVPIFAWLNTDRSRPWRVECRPLPFSTLLSFRRSML